MYLKQNRDLVYGLWATVMQLFFSWILLRTGLKNEVEPPPEKNRGLTWKRAVIAGLALNCVLLAAWGVPRFVLIPPGEGSVERPSGVLSITRTTLLIFSTLMSLTWSGIFYAHMTRFQVGPRAMLKRMASAAWIGALASMPLSIVFYFNEKGFSPLWALIMAAIFLPLNALGAAAYIGMLVVLRPIAQRYRDREAENY